MRRISENHWSDKVGFFRNLQAQDFAHRAVLTLSIMGPPNRCVTRRRNLRGYGIRVVSNLICNFQNPTTALANR